MPDANRILEISIELVTGFGGCSFFPPKPLIHLPASISPMFKVLQSIDAPSAFVPEQLFKPRIACLLFSSGGDVI